jgi:hypothetical protein
LTYLGFITEEKLAAVLITPSLGVPNWPVIYIINTAPPGALLLKRFKHYTRPLHNKDAHSRPVVSTKNIEADYVSYRVNVKRLKLLRWTNP